MLSYFNFCLFISFYICCIYSTSADDVSDLPLGDKAETFAEDPDVPQNDKTQTLAEDDPDGPQKNKPQNFAEDYEYTDVVKDNKSQNDEPIGPLDETPKTRDPFGIMNNQPKEPGFDLNTKEMNKFHIWPSGVIPYFIDDFSYDKVLRDKIRSYLDNVNKKTELRFIEMPQPPEEDSSRWVFFVNRRGQLGCADNSFNSFTSEGVQKVVLGYDCMSQADLDEVILSLVGVPPQHNAPNRDEFIQIERENILKDKSHLFEKLKDDQWLFHDLPYDFGSAGHYTEHHYTSNGLNSISKRVLQNTTSEDNARIRSINSSPHKGFSETDLKKIHMLYNYISRFRKSPKRVKECDKLFAPGTNYNNTNRILSIKDEIKPRTKPNKYLGLTNKDSLSNNDTFIEEEYEEKPIGISLQHSEEIFTNVTAPNIIKYTVANTEPRRKNITLLSHPSQKKHIFLGGSDYETGNEGLKNYVHEKD